MGGHEGLPIYVPHDAGAEQKIVMSMRRASCTVCLKLFGTGEKLMRCETCGMMGHVRCLARIFIQEAGKTSEIIPHEGCCPGQGCGVRLLWSQLVRNVRTCDQATIGVEDHHCSQHEIPNYEQAPRVTDDADHGRNSSPRVWLVDNSDDAHDLDSNTDSEGENPHASSDDALSDTPMETFFDENEWLQEGSREWLGETRNGERIIDRTEEAGGVNCGQNSSGRIRLAQAAHTQIDLCEEDDFSDHETGIFHSNERSENSPASPHVPLAERLRLRSLEAQRSR